MQMLSDHAFRPPPSAAKGGENLGWVSLHNLCVTEFTLNDCFYGQYFCWGLRIDNKKLPAKLVHAMLELRMGEWLTETGRDKVPAAVKAEMREQLELELFPRQLPTVSIHDVCWDIHSQTLRLFTMSNGANETFRLLFSQTFGYETRSVGPVDLAASHARGPEWLGRLDIVGHSDYRGDTVT